MTTLPPRTTLQTEDHVCHIAAKVVTTNERIAQALLRFSALSFSFLIVIGVYLSIRQSEVIENQNTIIRRLSEISALTTNVGTRVLQACIGPATGAPDDN